MGVEITEKDPHGAKEGRRVAAIKITPQFVFRALRLHLLFPDADLGRLGADYDFDKDVFKLKWECDDFPPHVEGEMIPYMEVTYGTDSHGEPVALSYKLLP